jgi:hypothetical protein
MIIGVMDMTKSNTDSLLYTTYFGGSDNDGVRALKLDADGNVLITGYTLSTDFPITGDALQSVNNGNGDAFVSIVNPNDPKFVKYSTYLGGSDGECAYDVARDSAGNLYVTGYTLSSDFPATPDAAYFWGQLIEIFVTKFKPGVPGKTALIYSTYVGGASVNVALGMAVGADGRIYTVGYTGGGLPVTGNAFQGSFGGGYTDGFIVVVGDPGTPSGQTKPAQHITSLPDHRKD